MGHKFYELLGVGQGCSPEELKKAYRKLAVLHHPDKGGDPEKFKEISHAYQILSDEEQRRRYDQLGDEGFEMQGGGGMPPGMDPMNIFEHLFGGGGGGFFGSPFGPGGPFGGGGGGPQKKHCRSLHHAISIPLRDAHFGCEKHIKITLHKKCFKCLEMCGTCQGRGQITEMQRMGPFTNIATRSCNACRGSGQIPKPQKKCGDCSGSGDITEEKRMDIKIPAGVETGWQKVFPGLGEQPQVPGDVAGDLIFEVMVQMDPLFERRGSQDYVFKQRLTLVESICGKVFEIPMFDGPIKVNTRDWGIVQPGKEYRVGRVIVVFSVDYPEKKLTDEEIGWVQKALVA